MQVGMLPILRTVSDENADLYDREGNQILDNNQWFPANTKPNFGANNKKN